MVRNSASNLNKCKNSQQTPRFARCGKFRLLLMVK